jgi:hypothetical protein
MSRLQVQLPLSAFVIVRNRPRRRFSQNNRNSAGRGRGGGALFITQLRREFAPIPRSICSSKRTSNRLPYSPASIPQIASAPFFRSQRCFRLSRTALASRYHVADMAKLHGGRVIRLDNCLDFGCSHGLANKPTNDAASAAESRSLNGL